MLFLIAAASINVLCIKAEAENTDMHTHLFKNLIYLS